MPPLMERTSSWTMPNGSDCTSPEPLSAGGTPHVRGNRHDMAGRLGNGKVYPRLCVGKHPMERLT